jgi:hypothetical protein
MFLQKWFSQNWYNQFAPAEQAGGRSRFGQSGSSAFGHARQARPRAAIVERARLTVAPNERLLSA